MNEQKKPAQRRYLTKVSGLLIRITIILAVPAILSYFLGNYLDNRFDIKPYGSLISMFLGLISSWIILVRMLIINNTKK